MADPARPAAAPAFHGDPTIKADLLAALDRGDPTPLVPGQADQPEPGDWVGRVGLPVALVLLTAHLGGRPKAAAPGGGFARELVSAIEPGASIEPVAHRLVIWAWEAAPAPLVGIMTSEQFRRAGDEAVALHRRAAEGGDVARGAWRTARTALGRLGQTEGGDGRDDQHLAASVMAACAWDYGAAPGAAVDMFTAWEGLVSERLRRADGWGEAEDQRLQQLIWEQKALALEQIGPEPAGGDPEAVAAHSKRVVDATIGRLNASSSPLPCRKGELNQRIGEARFALRAEAATALLALVRTPAVSETR